MDPNVLHNISYGMYVVSSHKGGRPNGQIANTLFQVASEPVIIGASINKKNLTHEFISSSGIFSASILAEDTPLKFIWKFGFKSGSKEDKFKGVRFEALKSGCPVVLDHALGYLEVKVTDTVDCGTHTLFLGEMAESRILIFGKPMTYEYYHQVKHGATPETAPTFIKGERK